MADGRLAQQLVAYAAFVGTLVTFAGSPAHTHLEPDLALIRLSMRISGDIVGECRTVAAPELSRLPPNMRAAEVCPRERADVRVRLALDGTTVVDETLVPRGLARDGAAYIHRRIPVAAGEHRLAVRVDLDAARAGPTNETERSVRLAPGTLLTIDYDPSRGGVVMR